MLVVSHKMIFIKNEAALVCITMRKRARAFAATTFWYKLCNYKVKFLWCTFHTHFGTETRRFKFVVFYLLSSKYRDVKICSYISNFLVRFALVSFVSHPCRSCRSCRTHIVWVLLVSHSCHSCLVPLSLGSSVCVVK